MALDVPNSVLDAILKVRDNIDGSIGSGYLPAGDLRLCGVRINGAGLACYTHLDVGEGLTTAPADAVEVEGRPNSGGGRHRASSRSATCRSSAT